MINQIIYHMTDRTLDAYIQNFLQEYNTENSFILQCIDEKLKRAEEEY